MKTKKEKPYCSGTMTKASFFSWIRSILRRNSIRWRPRSDFLKDNRKPYTGTDKRTKWLYKCSVCYKDYKSTNIEVDHLIECGSLKDFKDLPGFVKRLFCEKDGYRILCKHCHQKHTNSSRKLKIGGKK